RRSPLTSTLLQRASTPGSDRCGGSLDSSSVPLLIPPRGCGVERQEKTSLLGRKEVQKHSRLSHLSGVLCRNWHRSASPTARAAAVVAGFHRASPSTTLDKSAVCNCWLELTSADHNLIRTREPCQEAGSALQARRPVDHQVVADHEARLVGGEPKNRGGDLRRIADPSRGDRPLDPLVAL